MKTWRSLLTLIVVAALAAGCSATAPQWKAHYGRNHPLVGRLFDVRAARFLSPDELLTDLAGADYVLLGERHDNPDHHRLQADILARLIERGRRPAVAFEIFDLEKGPAIERHLRFHPGDAWGLAKVVDWRHSGWGPWRMYYPIVRNAVDAGVPVLAANLSRERVHDLARAAFDAGLENTEPASARSEELLGITQAGRQILELGLDRPIDKTTEESLARSIRNTHCGYAPEDMLPRMIVAQRARDAQMAAVLAKTDSRAHEHDDAVARVGAQTEGAETEGAQAEGAAATESELGDGSVGNTGAPADGGVLITGFGHARTDRGVPYYLRLLRPRARIASLAFLEVIDGAFAPSSYAAAVGASRLPFDYIWFTPRIESHDPCEVFRKQLEQMHSRAAAAHKDAKSDAKEEPSGATQEAAHEEDGG